MRCNIDGNDELYLAWWLWFDTILEYLYWDRVDRTSFKI